MENYSKKEKIKIKWEKPVINSIDFSKSEGKFGTFNEATDSEGNRIGS